MLLVSEAIIYRGYKVRVPMLSRKELIILFIMNNF